MARQRSILAVLAILLVGGCGYSLRGDLPGHIQTVSVPVFVNKTQHPAVENFLTSAVVDAFVTSGRLKVARPEDADSILEGEIVGYEVDSISFDRRANVREYRLTVTLNLQFRDTKRNVMLFRQEGIQEKADFRVPGQVSATFSLEQSALREAAGTIGRAIVNLTTERF